ncbi:MAG: pentapeptide repeat-containing protein [Oscillospiraceae bacterium]|nr:pentapeptide repeat-containing protein [Oscillospiraceae bacterium]
MQRSHIFYQSQGIYNAQFRQGSDFRFNGLRLNDLRFNDLRFNDLRFNDLRFNDLRFNDLRLNDLRFNDLRFNDLRFNDLRFNDLRLLFDYSFLRRFYRIKLLHRHALNCCSCIRRHFHFGITAANGNKGNIGGRLGGNAYFIAALRGAEFGRFGYKNSIFVCLKLQAFNCCKLGLFILHRGSNKPVIYLLIISGLIYIMNRMAVIYGYI